MRGSVLRSSLQTYGALLTMVACRAGSTATSGAPAPLRGGSTNSFSIAYRLAMPDPTSHLFDVRLDISNITGDVIRLQMPVWTTGRYARLYLARHPQERTNTGPRGVP